MPKRPDIERLRDIVAQLRDPEGGCPWDLEQDHDSLKGYLIEESYELLEAIDAADDELMREELGDVLLQVIFHTQLASERGAFDLQDVIEAISDKMVERHPHVFGDLDLGGEAFGIDRWEQAKQASGRRVLDGVPRAMPALHRAERLTEKAATVGFDWPDAGAVFDKVHEEVAELEEAVASGDLDAIEDELGDMLFVVANLARKLEVAPEDALRRTLAKFERRFSHIEDRLAEEGRSPREASLEEMEALWVEAKGRE